ncbi:MAG: hypothetical protein ACREGI_03175, partial [Candidatus Levyibacteriota bacterium]
MKFDIIGKKYIYFAISLLVIIPGIISLFLYGLDLSIDFTGGTSMTYVYEKNVSIQQQQTIEKTFQSEKIKLATIIVSKNIVDIKSSVIDQKQHATLLVDLEKQTGSFKEENYSIIGPTIGSEITANAIKGIFFASILIVLYIAYAFREVPKPARSIRFGIAAIIALLH